MTPQQRIDTFIQDPHKPGCVTGWSSLEKCKLMCEYITKENLKLGVDVGIYAGRATLSMGFGFQETQGVVWGIDAYSPEASITPKSDPKDAEWWQNLDYHRIYKSFVGNVQRHNLLPNVRWLVSTSEKASRFFDDDSIEIIHMDGCHNEDVSAPEIDWFLPKVKDGAYWFADDIDWPQMEKTMERYKELGWKEVYMPSDRKWVCYRVDK